MGSIWPEATERQKADGWKLDVKFLKKVRGKMTEMDGFDSGFAEEQIERCLIAAASVEINYKDGLDD